MGFFDSIFGGKKSGQHGNAHAHSHNNGKCHVIGLSDNGNKVKWKKYNHNGAATIITEPTSNFISRFVGGRKRLEGARLSSSGFPVITPNGNPILLTPDDKHLSIDGKHRLRRGSFGVTGGAV